MPRTTDLACVRARLEADRAWAAYALADLTPEYRAHADWYLDHSGVLLIYRGFQTPVLFAAGDVAALLGETARDPAYYLSVRQETLAAMRALGYRIEEEKVMLRMRLAEFTDDAPGGAVRLGPGDFEQAASLYDEPPAFFAAEMLRHGVYYGVREGGELVAIAGTHVFAPEESVACIGNVYTRRDRRNRGYSRAVTAAVTRELLGLRTVALNVNAANAPAIRVYERLGFVSHCEYREAIARR